MDEILIEVRPSHAEEFVGLSADAGLDIEPEGEASGLDGASIVAFSLSIAPSVLSIAELVLRKMLTKQRPIVVRTPKVTITADSLEDLDRTVEAIRALAVGHAD